MLRQRVLQEILDERVVSSRHRRNPRGVKRKMSNYPLRPKHSPPQAMQLNTAVKIIK